MNGCQTCGGYGMHHDPVAHGTEPRAKLPWSATTCEVCEGSGERENDLKRIVPCWYCKGSGWYEAAT